MGQLIDGVWREDDIISEIKATGHYVKQSAIFRDFITADGGSGFKAEPGRYYLYSSVGCPWAQRTELFRTLKQLEDIVPLFNTVQCPDGGGWWFKGDTHKVPGTEASISFLHELYALADPHYTGRVSVPTIWDAEKKTIVSNESSEIIRMFNSAFAEHTDNDSDFYPAHLRGEIDAMNAIVLAGVNDAVNGCGRSKSQIAYDESYDILFSTFDRLEDILSNRRYLCGDEQTEADWRLFPSLFRFDSIYYIGYKCNKQRIEDYPNLSNYLRDLYQTPGIAEASDLEAAKICIYAPGGPIASNGIVPKGPNVDFSRAHDRGRFEEAA